MTNPYLPTCGFPDAPGNQRSREQPGILRFWLQHFAVFQISFWIGWIAFFIVDGGVAKTVGDFLSSPQDLVVMAVVSTIFWMPHLILALFYRKMLYVNIFATASTGAAFHLLGMLFFNLPDGCLPFDLSNIIAMAPDYVRFTVYFTLSVAAVTVLIRLSPDNRNVG